VPDHEVVQGEDILTIAREYGIENWESIWDHPRNADLRRERPDPLVLAPGDHVFVPDYRGLVYILDSGSRHNIVIGNAVLRYIRLTLVDSRRNPYSEKNYSLTVANETVDGTTTPEGAIEAALPDDATTADLVLYPRTGNDELKLKWRLQLGYLNPLSKVSGVKARLSNLGYFIDQIDDNKNDQLTNAVELFRSQNSMPTAGAMDDEFLERLRLAYGGA